MNRPHTKPLGTTPTAPFIERSTEPSTEPSTQPSTDQGDPLTTKQASAPATDTASLVEPHAIEEGPSAPEAGLVTALASIAPIPVASDGDDLRRQMDELSLTQALLDFEMANARVLDLTARLVEANSRVLGLQAEADAARRTIDEVRLLLAAKETELAELKSSRSFKLAERIQTLLRALRG